MVKSLVIYTIICDYCGKDLCAEMKYCGWNTDQVTVEGVAKEEGWKEINYGHRCPECEIKELTKHQWN
jgi:hypothetical protein